MYDKPQFYLVWKEGSHSHTPTYKHLDFESARGEALRLSRLDGGKFHVLAHYGTARRVETEFEGVEIIPF